MRWAAGTMLQEGCSFSASIPPPGQDQLEVHPTPVGAAPSLGDKRLGHVRSGAAEKRTNCFGAIKSTRRR